MKIGILGAMEEEVKSIKSKMENVVIKTIANRNYYTGKLYGSDITLAFSRWGKVAASSTATSLINVFGAELVVFTGVAGAVAKELNIGDIVIGNGLYQHDMDARPIFPRHQIPLTDSKIFKPNSTYVKKAKQATDKFINNIECSITAYALSKFSILKPKAYYGIIASGDQFISDVNKHDGLQLKGEKVMAVEMEGAAVAQVCHEHYVPYVIIRTISDKANKTAEIDFQSFVSEVATHYSEGILKEFLTMP